MASQTPNAYSLKLAYYTYVLLYPHTYINKSAIDMAILAFTDKVFVDSVRSIYCLDSLQWCTFIVLIRLDDLKKGVEKNDQMNLVCLFVSIPVTRIVNCSRVGLPTEVSHDFNQIISISFPPRCACFNFTFEYSSYKIFTSYSSFEIFT